MGESHTAPFSSQSGLRGTIDTSQALDGSQDYVRVRLDDRRDVMVPANLLQHMQDGSYYLAGDVQGQGSGTDHTELHVPVLEEQIDVTKRQVTRGTVHVRKRVREREEVIDEPGFEEYVDVERVPINKPVEGPVEKRQEGDTLVIPLLEEVLVVRKQLILREEVRITRRRREVRHQQSVKLRREEVTASREEGDVDETSSGTR